MSEQPTTNEGPIWRSSLVAVLLFVVLYAIALRFCGLEKPLEEPVSVDAATTRG